MTNVGNYYLLQAKWDSLRVEIPSDRVTNLSHIGKEIYKVGKDTGEIYQGKEDSLIEMSLADCTDGISIRIAKKIALIGHNKTEERYVILINAKMLKERYFEGITQDNIKIVYDYIISKNIIKFEFEDFMSGYVYDCDACYDLPINQDDFALLCDKTKSHVLFNYQKYVNQFKKTLINIGLALNNRDAATPTKPFIKLYHKGLELQNKSYEFYSKFLFVKSSPAALDIGRFEYNFKGRKFFEYFDVQIKTLRELVEFDRNVIEDHILSSLKLFYLEERKIKRNKKYMTPTEFLLKYLFEYSISNGMGNDFFMKCLEDYEDHNPNVSREQIKRLKELIENNLSDEAYTERLEVNNRIEIFFNDIAREPK